MELASQVLFGLLGLIVFVFVSGITICEWEQRQRKKNGRG